jgi:tetratricopeptide (TPR) repeat protein
MVVMPSEDMKARMCFDQGRQCFAVRDFDNACDHFKNAVTVDPMFSEAHRYLAESYEKLGYRRRACKCWEGLLRITQDAEKQGDIRQRIDGLS